LVASCSYFSIWRDQRPREGTSSRPSRQVGIPILKNEAQSEWLALLPYMETEEFRELLGEGGADRLAQLLSATGFSGSRVRTVPCDPLHLRLAAQVLDELYGHPMTLVR